MAAKVVEQRCFLRCKKFSVWSNWERAMPVQEPQSVRRKLTNLRLREFFVCILSSLSSVFVGCQCSYRMSVSR